MGLRIRRVTPACGGSVRSREGTLLVRASNFHKSRILPLPQDATRQLEHHLQVRRQHNFPVG